MTRPLRVLVVTPFFPPDVGGVEAYSAWVARTARAAGHEVRVVSTTPGRRPLRSSYDGIDVLRLPTLVRLSNSPVHPGWWWQLRRVLREWRPDVVNVHAPVPGLADLTSYAAGRVPVVMTYHSGSLVKGQGGPVDALLRAYERHVLPRVFARCRELIAVSPVSTAYATGRAEIIPPGVDTELFHPPAERSAGETVLFVGRVETTSRWKGLHVLLDAVALLAQRRPGVRLEVAGDGDARPGLEEQARVLGIADRVTWHGALDQPALAPVYRGAAVTVLPSLTESESFGMSLVESMASGTPVVGSRVGGIPFVVREGVDGLLAAPGDAAGLADRMEELLQDSELAAELGRAGREAAVERWSWTRQEEHLLAVLSRAAGRPA